jgi:hypothetical protein
MISHFRPACLALALVLTAGPTCAQTWIYEPDNGARVYQPRVVYQERYVPRVYNSYAYAPVVTSPSVEVVATQRTVINRTIIPQGRGRGPIVRERIVSERYAPRRPSESGSEPRPRTMPILHAGRIQVSG